MIIECHPRLGGAARRAAADLGLDAVTVITGDAGESAQLAAIGPVDLWLLCGIFGNISGRDIREAVAATPALLRDGGAVIWTRGS